MHQEALAGDPEKKVAAQEAKARTVLAAAVAAKNQLNPKLKPKKVPSPPAEGSPSKTGLGKMQEAGLGKVRGMARGSELLKQVVNKNFVTKGGDNQNFDDGAGLTFEQFNGTLVALHFTASKDTRQLYHFLDFNNSGSVSRAEWATLASFNVESDRGAVEKFRNWLIKNYGSYDEAFTKFLEIIKQKHEEKARTRNTSKRGSNLGDAKGARGSVMRPQNFQTRPTAE